MSEPFIAEIRIFAGNFAPRGWAFCSGQLLPISQNTALFSLIGTTYGGDGRTTTALPNMQGRAPMHPGRGPGLTSRRLGERVGVEVVTLSESQIPSHNHVMRGNEEGGDALSPVNGHFGEPSDDLYTESGTTVDMANNILTDTGGGNSHNNMQPFLAMNFIIALVGLYPSRS